MTQKTLVRDAKNPQKVATPLKLEPRDNLRVSMTTVPLENQQVPIVRQLLQIEKGVILIEELTIKVVGLNQTLLSKEIH